VVDGSCLGLLGVRTFRWPRLAFSHERNMPARRLKSSASSSDPRRVDSADPWFFQPIRCNAMDPSGAEDGTIRTHGRLDEPIP